MKPPFTLTITESQFTELYEHLFPGDGDEHGAVIAAGIAETPSGTRLLAREIFLARDGIDFVPGTRGYRAFTAEFVVDKAGYCADAHLSYLTVHCHGGRDTVELSYDDLASHELGYPALVQMLRGLPVGGLVFAMNVVAGDLWSPSRRFSLDRLTIIGRSIRNWYATVQNDPTRADPMYDRQTRLFGDTGQNILSRLKVGIIGLGGGGSLVNEWCARLGVGKIVAIDPEKIDVTNLARIVGSTRWDAKAFLTTSHNKTLRMAGEFFAVSKVDIARRVATQANPNIGYRAVRGSIVDERIAKELTDTDFIFLCTDNMQSRLVFNAIVQQYLIPGVQIGVAVGVPDQNSGKISDIIANTRLVLPAPRGGCLLCGETISSARLQEESLTPDARLRQRYVDDPMVPDPSVITLNVLSAAQAINDLMMLFAGLYTEEADMRYQMHWVRERRVAKYEPPFNPLCTECSTTPRSRIARGDTTRLPCKMAF
jgi:tRNA A37 threonylcarbamoyladenosine dehydratase